MLSKHSVSIRGHRTSFSLEDEFWNELQRIAQEKGLPVARMITEIDSARPLGQNLSSALRVFVLKHALANTSIDKMDEH